MSQRHQQGAEVRDALETFGIPRSRIENGSAASTLLALLCGTEAERQQLPTDEHPRSTHQRWKFVFAQLSQTFGFLVPTSTREAIFCGDISACERLLDEVVVQAKAANTFALALHDHQSKQRELAAQDAEAARLAALERQKEKELRTLKSLNQLQVSTGVGGDATPSSNAMIMSPPHRLPPAEPRSTNGVPYSGVVFSDDATSGDHHFSPLRPLKLVTSVSVGTDPDVQNASGIELLTLAAQRSKKKILMQTHRRGGPAASPLRLRDLSAEERAMAREAAIHNKKRRDEEAKVREAELAMREEERKRAFRARLFEQAVRKKGNPNQSEVDRGGGSLTSPPPHLPAVLPPVVREPPKQAAQTPAPAPSLLQRASSTVVQPTPTLQRAQNTALPTTTRPVAAAGLRSAALPQPVLEQSSVSGAATGAPYSAAAAEERRRKARLLLEEFKPKPAPPPPETPTPSTVSSLPHSRAVSTAGTPSTDREDDDECAVGGGSVQRRRRKHGAGANGGDADADDLNSMVIRTHEVAIDASPPPVSKTDAAVEMRPLPSVPQLVTLVQTFCRVQLTRMHNVYCRNRAPAAAFLQRMFRFVIHWRARKNAPPPYEAFPTSRPLTTCSRCLPILTLLEQYVIHHHAISGVQLSRYRAWLCPVCRPLLEPLVTRTQDCNIFRDDFSALRRLAQIQAAMRWLIAMNVLDTKIHLAHLAYAHKFERSPREMEILNWVQMRFLFSKWKALFWVPRRLQQSGVGECRRCGPIVGALMERSRGVGVNAFDRSRYTDLMCESCREIIEKSISSANVLRCASLLFKVLTAVALLKRKVRWQREKRRALMPTKDDGNGANAAKAERLLKRQHSRFWPQCKCERCCPIVDALGERLVADRDAELIAPYAVIMCAACRRWAADAIVHVNVHVATEALRRVTSAKVVAIRWSGRAPALDALVAHPECSRCAPLMDELEKRLFSCSNGELDDSTVARYEGWMCKTCAGVAHARCASARKRLEYAVLVQLVHRFRMHMRQVHDRRRVARILVDTDCRRCGPIKAALNERIRANPRIESAKLRRYVALMCKSCTAQSEAGIAAFEAQRDAVRFFENVYTFIRAKRLMMARAPGVRRRLAVTAATRGQCARCAPILTMYAKSLKKCQLDMTISPGAATDASKAAIEAASAREMIAQKYVPIVCGRCRFQVIAMARNGIDPGMPVEGRVEVTPDDAVPGRATVVPPRLRGVSIFVDLGVIHQSAAPVVQALLRWRSAQRIVTAAVLCAFAKRQPNSFSRAFATFQTRWRFKSHIRRKGGVTASEDMPWGCKRCSPIVSALTEFCGAHPRKSLPYVHDKYLRIMCKRCDARALRDLDCLAGHPRAAAIRAKYAVPGAGSFGIVET